MQRVKMFLFIFSLLISLDAQAIGNKSIYSGDDRVSISEASLLLRRLAASTAIMVSNYYLMPNIDYDQYELFAPLSLREKKNVCSDVAFASDYAIGSCSGFLIAPDKLVTAAHCIPTGEECAEFSWVFGLEQDQDILSVDQVYTCSKVKRPRLNWSLNNPDMVIITLDRKVKHYYQLTIDNERQVDKGDNIFTIGSPLGLALKFSGNAKITKHTRNHCLSNLDTFQGNSGSPVFSKRTGNVIGMVVSGGQDFIYNKYRNCFELKYKRKGQEKVIWLKKALREHF